MVAILVVDFWIEKHVSLMDIDTVMYAILLQNTRSNAESCRGMDQTSRNISLELTYNQNCTIAPPVQFQLLVNELWCMRID